MASLYKRASPAQRRVMKIVEGAVRNAAHSHPNVMVPETFARSVAKRAAGTLTASWPEVLAARSASSDRVLSQTLTAAPAGVRSNDGHLKRGPLTVRYRRSPLIDLWSEISKKMHGIKRSGQIERYEALVEVLRLIAAKHKERG
jgi:hypothetical protein